MNIKGVRAVSKAFCFPARLLPSKHCISHSCLPCRSRSSRSALAACCLTQRSSQTTQPSQALLLILRQVPVPHFRRLDHLAQCQSLALQVPDQACSVSADVLHVVRSNRKFYAGGITAGCSSPSTPLPVEIRLRAFIPTQVIYLTDPFERFFRILAFNGNDRTFCYDCGTSKADIQTSFTVTSSDLYGISSAG